MCYFSCRDIISLSSCPVCWHSWCRAGTPLLAASMTAARACMAREQHRGWRSESGMVLLPRMALAKLVLTNSLSRAWTSPTTGLGQGLQESQVCTGAVCLWEALHCFFSVRSPSQVAWLQLPWVCLKELWSHLQFYCPAHPSNVQKNACVEIALKWCILINQTQLKWTK